MKGNLWTDVQPNHQGTSLTKKKERKKEDKNGSEIMEEENEDEDDDDDWSVDVSEQAVRDRMKDLTAGVKGLTVSNDAEKPLSERLELFYGFCSEVITCSLSAW